VLSSVAQEFEAAMIKVKPNNRGRSSLNIAIDLHICEARVLAEK